MKIKLLLAFAMLLGLTTMAQQKTNYKIAVVAFYNLENFYDTTDNPIVNDDDFTPKGSKNYNG